MNILVTGGAGYIGSHMVNWLLGQNHNIVVIDNLTNGHRDVIPNVVKLYNVDIGDIESVTKIFKDENFDAVFHFAGLIQVAESVKNPFLYYENNVNQTIKLLKVMIDFNVLKIIFSSTAAVYGVPSSDCIQENHIKNPINPYGRSKLMIEEILSDFDAAYGLKSVCLRYFNAAGAHPDGILGERHHPETHLIPLALEAALGIRENFKIYGSDYPTEDGTCVRDFIHVWDLCDAHYKALNWLISENESEIFNLGTGKGYSITDVLNSIESISLKKINKLHCDRREGDPPKLISSAIKAATILKWTPKFSDLNQIIFDAYNFLNKKTPS